MSKTKELIGKIPAMAIQTYFLISIMIFTPYLNWKYANENGFIKWLLFGEIAATWQAAIWPYYLYERHYVVNDGYDPNWPDTTPSESERLKNVIVKMKDRQLTAEDLNEYKSVMMEYSKRVGRKFVFKDTVFFTQALDLIYTYRSEFGKTLLESIDKQTPIITSEYEAAKTAALKSGMIKEETIASDRELILKAANRDILTDSSGISYYPPTREHVLDMNNKTNILKDNIDDLKNVHYQMIYEK